MTASSSRDERGCQHAQEDGVSRIVIHTEFLCCIPDENPLRLWSTLASLWIIHQLSVARQMWCFFIIVTGGCRRQPTIDKQLPNSHHISLPPLIPPPFNLTKSRPAIRVMLLGHRHVCAASIHGQLPPSPRRISTYPAPRTSPYNSNRLNRLGISAPLPSDRWTNLALTTGRKHPCRSRDAGGGPCVWMVTDVSSRWVTVFTLNAWQLSFAARIRTRASYISKAVTLKDAQKSPRKAPLRSSLFAGDALSRARSHPMAPRARRTQRPWQTRLGTLLTALPCKRWQCHFANCPFDMED